MINQGRKNKLVDKVVIYAFLTVIKEKKGNISSLLAIFQELVEGLLSTWVKKQLKGGRIIDLQEEFKLAYSIDIPIPTLKTILNNIIQKNNSLLTTYDDDTFTINEFPDINFDLILEKQQSEISAFYNLYERYLDIKGLKVVDYDLMLFFDQNKRYIIKCLTGSTGTQGLEEKYHVQAQFIRKLLYYKRYCELINKIFLGSIISSYIELEIDDSTKHNKILLLDTNFIISLLDLHSEESFQNCKMLIEIANRLKYKVEIMPYTIDETSALLKRYASNLNGITYFQSLDKNSIYHGCFRKNIDASGLLFIANKFEEMLREKYGILITDVRTNNAMLSEAKQSKFYQNQKNRRYNPDGALHDATVLYYTAKLRKGSPKSFKDINSWFVTNTPSSNENLNILDQNAPLMIRAAELLNIMWLSSPSYDANIFIQTTISELLSATLSIIPDEKMLKALDRKIQAIKDYPVSAKDCIQVAEVIGSIENQQLKLLLEKNTQEDIINELTLLSKIAREREDEKHKQDEEFLKLVKDDMQRSVEKEKAILEKLKNLEIEEIAIEARNEALNKEIELLEEIVKRDNEELSSLKNDILLQVPIKAERFTKKLLLTFGFICSILFLFSAFFIKRYWSFAEPLLYLASFIPWIIAYFIGIFYSKKLSFTSIKNMITNNKENKLKKRYLSYFVKADKIEKRIINNENRINTIKKTFLYC